MATINVATSQNLTAVTYATGDIINVQDGATLTINSSRRCGPSSTSSAKAALASALAAAW